MSWALFLDDIRDVTEGQHQLAESLGLQISIARNLSEAKLLVELQGMPQHIFFDHDLGEEERAIDLVKHLINLDMDAWLKPEVSNGEFTQTFTYTIHSDNPVGRDNIRGLLDSYLRFKFTRP